MACPIVAEDEIVDHQGAARLERLAELAQDCEIFRRRLLVGDVAEDREIVLPGSEIGGVEVAINRLEALGKTEVRPDCYANQIVAPVSETSTMTV